MKKNFKKRLSALMSVILFSTVLGTGVPAATVEATGVEWKVSTIFGNDMILQRNKPVKIFGVGGMIGGTVRVTFAEQTKTTVIAGEEWSLYLDAMDACATGRDMVVEYFAPGATAATNTVTYTGVLVGELWLCGGQSNMEFHIWWLSSKYWDYFKDTYWALENLDKIRVYTQREVEATEPQNYVPQEDWGNADWENNWITGRWVTPSNKDSAEFGRASATAVGFAAQLQKELGPEIPVGVIVSAKGASQIEMWLDAQSVKDAGTHYSDLQSKLYNGMIHQIRGMSIAGILWYQGEANEWAPETYKRQFAEYADSYRGFFEDKNLPIIYFQLPQFEEQINESWGKVAWQNFRQTQWDLMELVGNTYAVCGIDLGDHTDIHPGDKFEFTRRATGVALKYVYDREGTGLSPYPTGIYREADSLRVDLKDAKSLNVSGEIKGFEGFNGTEWVPLTAQLDGTDIVLTGNVANITSVRYLYATIFTDTAFIYNEYGLPVAPFKEIAVGVKPGSVAAIAIETMPTKTEYYNGEAFDATGMVVKASYTDGRPDEVVDDYTVLEKEVREGMTDVTLRFGDATTAVPVTVKPIETAGSLSTAGNMKLEVPEAVTESKYAAISATLKATPGVNMEWWPAYCLGFGRHIGAGEGGADATYRFQLVYGLEDGNNISMVKLDWNGFTYGGQAIPQEQRVENRLLEQVYTEEGMQIQFIRMKTMVFLKAYLENEWRIIGRIPVPEDMKTEIHLENWGSDCELSDIQIAIGKQNTLDVFNGVNFNFATNPNGEFRYFPMGETDWMVDAKDFDGNPTVTDSAKRLMTVQDISILYQNWEWWTQEVQVWGLTHMTWDLAWVFPKSQGLYVRYLRTGNELRTYLSVDGVNWTQGHCRSGLNAMWDDIILSNVEASNIKDMKIYIGEEAYQKMQGDVTLDGKTDVRDLVRLKKKVTLTTIYDRKADWNQDQIVDAVDLKDAREYFVQ